MLKEGWVHTVSLGLGKGLETSTVDTCTSASHSSSRHDSPPDSPPLKLLKKIFVVHEINVIDIRI